MIGRILEMWGVPSNRPPVLVILATLAVCGIAVAQTPTGNVFRLPEQTTTCVGSPCSGAAPSGATDGRNIAQARAISVRLCAASGQTLSGAGTLDVYLYDEDDGLWSLAPLSEIEVPADCASKRCCEVLEDRDVLVGFGRVAVVPNAVTVSAATTLSVKIKIRVKEQP
jgi:hypothetical protein